MARVLLAPLEEILTVFSMGVSASLQVNELTVAPGAEVATELRVRNNGSVVDQLTLQPLGEANGWMVLDPPVVSLFPGAEETVTVRFRPPKAPSSAAGPSPFAVRVLSREDAEGSVVAEGTITVEPFDDRSIEALPRTARGRRKARFDVAFDNRGNVRAAPRLGGLDPDEQLRFSSAPPGLNVAAGKAQFAKLTVRPRGVFWKGPPKTHTFQVIADEDGKAPLVADASFMQEPLLPPWLWKAVAVAAAACVALVVLWLTVLKPTIRSTAKDAIKAPLGDINKRLDAAGVAPAGTPPTTAKPGGAGGGAGAGGGGTAGGSTGGGATGSGAGGGGANGSGAAGSGGTGAGGAQAGALSGAPTDFRLAPGNATAAHTFAAGQVFSLTDLVLQNPNGDTGTITIMRGNASGVLFSSALQNFRDLDFHFVAPYVFNQQPFLVTVTCTTPGAGGTCSSAVSAAGFQRSA